ncbi:hypothetical protein K440DRAFT_625470 [Wilcoxina mikolae CBS 423.85]|nr:hypothetical protein K440DRAFT_625470 [Wilcoxina mikolae CBS 423.85]
MQSNESDIPHMGVLHIDRDSRYGDGVVVGFTAGFFPFTSYSILIACLSFGGLTTFPSPPTSPAIPQSRLQPPLAETTSNGQTFLAVFWLIVLRSSVGKTSSGSDVGWQL